MDPQAAQRLIQTQPQKADAQAREWSVFASEHPGVSHFVLKQEFDAWARTHADAATDTSIWDGKEIQDAYFHLRQQYEEEQLETQDHVDHNSIPTGLATLGFLAVAFARERPKIIEEDGDFKLILKQKGEDWFNKNPNKDATSKEWLDYRYGSLENPSAPTLSEETEKAFREDVRFAKRVERYDKERKMVYENLDEDPAIVAQRLHIDHHTELLYEHHKKQNPSIKKEDIIKKVQAYHWEKFVEKNEDKAKAYAEKYEEIKSVVLRIEERKKQTVAPKIETKAVVQPIAPKPPFSPQIPFPQKPLQPLQVPISEPFFSLPTTQTPSYPQQRTVSSPPPPRTPPGGGAVRNPLAGLGNTLGRARFLINPFTLTLIGVGVATFFITIITVIAEPATIGEASPEPSASFTPVAAPPPNTNTEALRSDLSNQFNVEFDPSFDSRYYNYLKWAWDILWSVSNTNFRQLFNPNNSKIKVVAIPINAGFNEQYDCDKIGIRLGRINPPHDPYDEQFFKIIFIHELSHLIEIENCRPDSISRKSQLDQIIKQEGYLTNFSKNSGAVGDIPLNEDYAESFAYLINSTIPELKLNICLGCDPIPNANGQIVNPYQNNKPLHKQFVQDLLGVPALTPTNPPINP